MNKKLRCAIVGDGRMATHFSGSLYVEDSLAMTMHGYDSTIPADSDLMALHTTAVRKGAPSSFIIGDMPFLSFWKRSVPTMKIVKNRSFPDDKEIYN